MPTEEAYLFEYRFPIAERALESESSAIALVSGRRASCRRERARARAGAREACVTEKRRRQSDGSRPEPWGVEYVNVNVNVNVDVICLPRLTPYTSRVALYALRITLHVPRFWSERQRERAADPAPRKRSWRERSEGERSKGGGARGGGCRAPR